jgi:hypothetical protein
VEPSREYFDIGSPEILFPSFLVVEIAGPRGEWLAEEAVFV